MHKIMIKLYSDKPLHDFIFKERYLFIVKSLNENYLIKQCNDFFNDVAECFFCYGVSTSERKIRLLYVDIDIKALKSYYLGLHRLDEFSFYNTLYFNLMTFLKLKKNECIMKV